jgi:hypothetical protein
MRRTLDHHAFPGKQEASVQVSSALYAVRVVPHPDALAQQLGDGIVLVNLQNDAVFELVCQWFGAEAIHAAAVCDPRGVVAFAGVSGSGKSTLVAWLGGRGFEPWADDVLLWQGSHEQLVTRALPFSVRPRPGIGSLERLPCWERTTFGAESVPLRALILLEPQTATTSTTNTPVRVGPSQALQQIMLHALCFGFAVANQKRRLVASYARLCSELPCYSVTLTRGEESLRVLEQWLGE